MISGIKEFYDTLPEGKASVQSEGGYTEKEFVSAYCRRLVEAGVENKILKISVAAVLIVAVHMEFRNMMVLAR